MKRYSSKDVLKMLKADGWFEVNCEGDHHQFKHSTKPGKVTLRHPVKDLGVRDLKSIERQSGLKF
ncbi:type II toxin-antitoxin system HicA family toxin [Selenomonas sputigena]|uniref:type II toxin-antitoxin system HicA family toxin n=1 Tax=Selenomonas sputigena TaxID=69823 RepID=UPI002230F9DC|nr:type II toxin-antitoxin system HicA family toxin [Selenomonas sputigena]UZD42720.1 type II toxin-antitoxin system HicA family toxin [Selenomonas sputigena]